MGLQLERVSSWSFFSSNLPPLHVLVCVCDVRSCSSHAHHPAVQKGTLNKHRLLTQVATYRVLFFHILCVSLEP
jgi:hypothetical protein